jgi:hypothetical protein
MSAMAKLVMRKFYRAATGRPERLPWHRSQATIQRLFAPELTLMQREVTDFERPPPPGPGVRGVGYWFQPASA